jgi:hypothetical protein
MNIHEIRRIGKQRGVDPRALIGMKRSELIKAIQVGEGNEVCYQTGKAASCGQTDCLWRDDCS